MVQLYLSGKLSLLLLPATSRSHLITCALSFQYFSYSLNWKQWYITNTWLHFRFSWGPCCSSFSFRCCIFVVFCCLRPVSYYPMLPVSLDYPIWIVPSAFSNVYSSFVMCTQCCQCLWIIHSWVPLRFSLDCHFLIVPSVLSNLYFIHYHLKWIKIQIYT